MAEKIVVDTSILIEALEHGDEELLLKLARMEVLVPYVALYEYLWGYLYLNSDYLKEKELVDKLFRVVYRIRRSCSRRWRWMYSSRRRVYESPQADLLVAATALVLDAPS
mgnify:CR=1 FL=1